LGADQVKDILVLSLNEENAHLKAFQDGKTALEWLNLLHDLGIPIEGGPGELEFALACRQITDFRFEGVY